MVDHQHRATHVAQEAIRKAIADGSFKAPEMTARLAGTPSRQTVTRILRQLESDGWLERETPNSSIWRAGPKCRNYGQMTDTTKRHAERDTRGPDGYTVEKSKQAADAYVPGEGSPF